MQQSHFQIRKLAAQSLVGLHRGLHAFFRLLDHRAYPIGLLALRARGADAREHLRTASRGKHAGGHGPAPGRQLVDHRNVEVGEIGHGERARDRRGAHHELVRQCVVAFLAQREALLHAEAMLLVDHGEPQPRELDTFLHQRVRTDGDLRFARRDRRECPLLFSRGQGSVQPGDAHPERLEPFAELARMLLREDLGRRHHRGLMSGVGRRQAGDRRDHRLAAADVALQQALHRVWLYEIAQHLVQRARLRARELERQPARERLEERAVGAQHGSGPAAPLAIGESQRQLLREQFVELHAPPGRMRALDERCGIDPRRRPMQQPHRLVEGRQRISGAQSRRHGVLQRAGVERLEHLGTQRPLPDASARRIHRRQALRQRLAARNEPVARVRHFGAKQAATNLAEGSHVPALLYGLLELRELARAKVKETQHHPLGIHQELAVAAENDGGALNARLHQHRTAGRCGVDWGDDGLVLVAQRQVQDEVEAGTQPQLLELPGLHPACKMASISTSAPRGRPATPTAARDG